MLANILKGATASAPKLLIQETHEATDTANLSSYSFSNCAFGDAADDRWVVVAISAYSG